jgi:hypothetical protein
MRIYEKEIREMINKIAKVEDNGAVWKERYCELEIMVNHIEGLRSNCRLNKLCAAKESEYTPVHVDRPSEIEAEKDVLYSLPPY